LATRRQRHRLWFLEVSRLLATGQTRIAGRAFPSLRRLLWGTTLLALLVAFVALSTCEMQAIPGDVQRVGRMLFTDGVEREVSEDAEGRQFVEDDGERVAGQWLPPAEEPAIVEHPLPARPQ